MVWSPPPAPLQKHGKNQLSMPCPFPEWPLEPRTKLWVKSQLLWSVKMSKASELHLKWTLSPLNLTRWCPERRWIFSGPEARINSSDNFKFPEFTVQLSPWCAIVKLNQIFTCMCVSLVTNHYRIWNMDPPFNMCPQNFLCMKNL